MSLFTDNIIIYIENPQALCVCVCVYPDINKQG